MAVLTTKWGIAVLVFIAILLFLYLIGQKSVHSELLIEASPEKIWKVLMDKADYEKWNQVLIPIEGDIKKGNNLRYKLIQPDGNAIEIEMKVVQLVPLKLLNQRGGFPGIFTFNHRYILEPIGNNTKVIIHEDFKGIVVLFWDVSWVQQAYAKLNKSLRQYILN